MRISDWSSDVCSSDLAKPSAYFELGSASPPVTGAWTDVGTQDAAAEQAIDRVKGMSILLLQPSYPYVQVMVVGGGQDPESATTFQMINLSTLNPKWGRSEEHTSELQSLMRISYAVFCLKQKTSVKLYSVTVISSSHVIYIISLL